MRIGRRHFIVLIGSAVAAASRAVAEQASELPVIGFLHAASVESYVSNAAAFAQGLKETGFAEAQNLAIEYRFASGRSEKVPMLAAEIVSRRPALIVAGGAAAAVAAAAATSAIPIVHVSGSDPFGQQHAGGNVTGVTFATAGLMSKRLDLLRELVPAGMTVGYLCEDGRAYAPGSPISRAVAALKSEILAAAGASGWQVIAAEIGNDRDYESALATLVKYKIDALVVAPSAMFASDVEDIVSLTLRDEIPTIFQRRADVVASGLMSYGASQKDAWLQGGIYAGRILKGAKPAELPSVQSGKIELVINRVIARSLGITIPPDLLAQADEVLQ